MRHVGPGFLLAVLLAAVAVEAQNSPDTERGARPGLAYRIDGLDHVNLFNGTLTANIPLGQRYTINGTLSYSFAASYATNAWDAGYHETCYFDSDGYHCDEYAYQYPAAETNAGLGWMVTMGRLVEDNESGMVYVAPDGSKHTFYYKLHDADAAEPVDNKVMYTRDGTYLRLRRSTSISLAGTLEFPGGERHTFDSAGRLTRIADRFSNTVDVAYSLQSSTDPDFANQPLWTITDSLLRQHRVYFRRSWQYYEDAWGSNVDHSVVDRVELAAFNGSTATYRFNYDALPPATPPAALDTTLSTSRRCVGKDDPQTPNYIYVPLLRSIAMPENVQYEFEIDRGDRGGCSRVPFGGFSGNMTRLTLPTGGSIDWTYQPYVFPAVNTTPGNTGIRPSYNAGIKTRTTSLGGRTEYEVGRVSEADMWSDLFRVVKNYDRDVLLNQTKHYFTGCRTPFGCSDGRSTGEYGLPFSRTATLSTSGSAGGGFLSTELQAPSNDSVSTLRRTYVRYEYDAPILYQPDPAHQRVAYERTVYVDDASRYTDVSHSDFDGLGHYRRSTTGGSFAERNNSRTTFVNYNKNAGTFAFAADGTLKPGFTMPSASATWLLNTYDRQWVAEDTNRLGGTVVTQVAEVAPCFDSNGFLTSQRTYKNFRSSADTAPVADAGDLLAVFTRETVSGHLVLTERYYRGQVTFACGGSAPVNEEYHVRHEYEDGALARSWPVKANGSAHSFFLTDTQVDRNTGLPAKTYRFRTNTPGFSDGTATTYTFDMLGRPKTASSSDGSVTYAYALQPAVITTTEKSTSGAVLRSSSVRFDAFGRPVRETRLMPNGTTSARETAYNSLGWTTSVTDWGASAPTIYTHDALGRPTRIKAPDHTEDTAPTMSYSGASQVVRTQKVATGGTVAAPVLSTSTTTEDFDRHGRLIRVTEPLEAVGGTRPRTEYFYDVGGRLTEVCANLTAGCGQTRTFAYDARGFLTSETHPESGTVQYEHDARGHVLRRSQSEGVFDVRFKYDRAERLEWVDEKVGGLVRPLKRFVFHEGNASGNMGNGQVKDAVRYNWLLNGFLVQVRETYTYGDGEGRPTKKNTSDYYCQPSDTQPCTTLFSGTKLHEFEQTFGYDGTGATTQLGYPQRCLLGSCTGPDARTVDNTYTNGFLTGVTTANRSNTISYHQSGSVDKVTHANSVVDTHTPDLKVPSRPGRIDTANVKVAGACVVPTFTAQPQSKTVSSGGKALLQAAASGEDGLVISFTWYRGTAPDRVTPVATGASYTAEPQTTTSYWVEARNGCANGVAESQTATVSVCDPPATSAGDDKAITRGQTAKLVAASTTGTKPLAYQWYTVVNNVESAIGGATGAVAYVTPTQTTVYRVIVTNACGSARDDKTVTVIDAAAPPANVRATYNAAAGAVAVSWNASTSSAGIDGYLVTRQPGNRSFSISGTGTTYSDTTELVGGTAYSYSVRALDGHSAYSQPSAIDFATVVAFPEPIRLPGDAGGTLIRGVHISELRQAIDAVRRLAGLSLIWTSYAPPTGGVAASHFTELRDRLSEARIVLGFEGVAFSSPAVSQQVVRGSAIIELRASVE